MFEFVDDIESRILDLQQKHSKAISEFQTLLQKYQKLKAEHNTLLENNQLAYSRLEKLLEKIPEGEYQETNNSNNQKENS